MGLSSFILLSAIVPAIRCKSSLRCGLYASIRQPLIFLQKSAKLHFRYTDFSFWCSDSLFRYPDINFCLTEFHFRYTGFLFFVMPKHIFSVPKHISLYRFSIFPKRCSYLQVARRLHQYLFRGFCAILHLLGLFLRIS